MKKICLLATAFILILSLCSCGSPDVSLKEGQLLYDYGAVTVDDVLKYEFLYEGYQGDPENKIEITDENDFAVFTHYTYVSDLPTEQFHEIFVFPSNTFTITISGNAYDFYLHDDGSLTYIPGSGWAKTYQADESHRISQQTLNEWITKYDP